MLPDTVAVWVISTSCSPTASASLRARTVTVAGSSQVPLVPPVNVIVAWSPVVSGSVSTATVPVLPEATVTVTSSPGSVVSTSV